MAKDSGMNIAVENMQGMRTMVFNLLFPCFTLLLVVDPSADFLWGTPCKFFLVHACRQLDGFVFWKTQTGPKKLGYCTHTIRLCFEDPGSRPNLSFACPTILRDKRQRAEGVTLQTAHF